MQSLNSSHQHRVASLFSTNKKNSQFILFFLFFSLSLLLLAFGWLLLYVLYDEFILIAKKCLQFVYLRYLFCCLLLLFNFRS